MKQILTFLILLIPLIIHAQQYSGMSGLIHVPSAEMDSAGDARIGAHYLDKHMLPNHPSFMIDGKKYNTFDTYISLTPFWWLEVGLTLTFEKGNPTKDGKLTDTDKFLQKDRYFAVKLNPLREGKYHPALAIGIQDCFSSTNKTHTGIFTNYYLALTKHLDIREQELSFNIVYRHYSNDYNRRWNGVIGGITYRPSFAKNWHAIVEWTGCDINMGIDCLLWRHLLLQASLQEGRYPSAGICYKVNLF